MWKLESLHWSKESKMVQSLWKTIWQLLKKLNSELPYNPAVSKSYIYIPKRTENMADLQEGTGKDKEDKGPCFSETEWVHGYTPGLGRRPAQNRETQTSQGWPKTPSVPPPWAGQLSGLWWPPGSGPRTLQSAREFPLVHLPPTQEMVAAKRQCCTIKVFVKKLSWVLWAILRALFRLAVSGEKKQHSVWRQTRASVEGVARQQGCSWEAGPLGYVCSFSTNLLCDFG